MENNNKNRNIIAIMCASILVLSLIITNSYANKSNNKEKENMVIGETRYIYKDDVSIIEDPYEKHKSISKLNAGDKVTVLYTIGDWSKVKSNLDIGYVKNDLLSYLNPKELMTFKISKGHILKANNDNIIDKIAVTENPSTDSKVICSIQEGVAVHLVRADQNYSQIEYNGKTGYVSNKYIHEQDIQESMDSVVNIAQRNINKPYNYKVNKYKLNNTGFIRYVYKEAMYKNISENITVNGKTISKDRAKSGDVVSFDINNDNIPDKFGIYLGNNEFIHASLEDEKVKKDNLSTQPYNDIYHSVIRVIY